MNNFKAAEIVVRFTRPGLHCWPDATGRRAYLAHKHRHMFYVEVTTGVTHDDREIEFHDLLQAAEDLFPIGDFGIQSCEMLARELAEGLQKQFRRPLQVAVFEDNEVGARVRFGG
jgi:hypothetical protein